jgi:translin
MIQEITERIHKDLEEKDSARESSLKLSRQVVRNCRSAMFNIHRDNFEKSRTLIESSQQLLEEMDSLLREYQDIYYAGFVEHAQQEFVECCVVYGLLKNGVDKSSIPLPEELHVGHAAYLNGLGDVPGEIRRHILDIIRQGRPQDGEPLLNTMEEIYSALMLFEYPDAITRGLRHKTDRVRSIIERTRGDLTNAMGQQKLEHSMRELESRL